ncbi:MAG TPA: helix-turn-helix domain-containing protein, partial [Thermoleophilaceae bacterium]
LPPGRHGFSDDEVAESQRGRLLAAMIEIVGRDGYHATSVTDVTARAGVSRKAFYDRFGDKEQCFIAAYEDALEKLLALALEAFETQDAWADRLRAGLSALLHALAREPEVARVCFVEVMAAGPRAVAARNTAMRDFSQLFDPGRSDRELALPDAVALSMVGALSEVLYREIAEDRTAELPASLAELMYTVVLPVLGSEAAERELERGRAARTRSTPLKK